MTVRCCSQMVWIQTESNPANGLSWSKGPRSSDYLHNDGLGQRIASAFGNVTTFNCQMISISRRLSSLQRLRLNRGAVHQTHRISSDVWWLLVVLRKNTSRLPAGHLCRAFATMANCRASFSATFFILEDPEESAKHNELSLSSRQFEASMIFNYWGHRSENFERINSQCCLCLVISSRSNFHTLTSATIQQLSLTKYSSSGTGECTESGTWLPKWPRPSTTCFISWRFTKSHPDARFQCSYATKARTSH